MCLVHMYNILLLPLLPVHLYSKSLLLSLFCVLTADTHLTWLETHNKLTLKQHQCLQHCYKLTKEKHWKLYYGHIYTKASWDQKNKTRFIMISSSSSTHTLYTHANATYFIHAYLSLSQSRILLCRHIFKSYGEQ